MPIPSPNLDDRDFNQLVEEARRQIQQSAPEWTDLSAGDPGMVLLELFAHLTETMIYRLNRLPEKAYIEFLRLIGVDLQPPVAASVELRFSRSRAGDGSIEIPRGTRVTLSRSESGSEPPVFVTAQRETLPPGETSTDVLAYHCEQIDAELAGIGTGLAGLTVQARRPPIIAPTGDELDLIVGVETAREVLGPEDRVITHEGKTFRVWREVPNFTNLGPDRWVYVADRLAGLITFAPAARIRAEEGELEETPRALAAIPGAGQEVRLWYRRGGGPQGNVAANTLTVLKDSIPGVEVTNVEPATGGRAAESVENALVRGPQELHSLHRAVTARDFELIVLHSSPAIARARALTRAAIWSYAVPGAVEVLLVPQLPEEERGDGRVTATALHERETETARSQIQQTLDERRPLGTFCVVDWAHYKTVRVKARVVVRREADVPAVRRRVVERLHQTINPLPTPVSPGGWPFGRALRASHIYDVALAESGVLWVDGVRLVVEEVPDARVRSIAADAFQPHTWYAGSGATLFRSLDDGEGWEPAGVFEDEENRVVRTHPERAGLMAVVTALPDASGSRIHLSRDCGESWQETAYALAFRVRDMAWMLRDDEPVLLLATDRGLYELVPHPDSGPVQLLVDQQDPDLGFYAVAAGRDRSGLLNVAVAAQSRRGTYLATSESGRLEYFRRIDNVSQGGNAQGQDIRVLAIQRAGPRTFLWAGARAAGKEAGDGCFRWELRGTEDPPEGWRHLNAGWTGGSCLSLAFLGTRALAGSYRRGVLYLDTDAREPEWNRPDVRCGLPLHQDPEEGPFLPVETVAAGPEGRWAMAGSAEGVFRTGDRGVNYQAVSESEFTERVTLPPTWLFCSGEHEIQVVSEDEANRD